MDQGTTYARRHHKTGFLEMSDKIALAMQKIAFIKHPTYEDYLKTDKETRNFVASLL